MYHNQYNGIHINIKSKMIKCVMYIIFIYNRKLYIYQNIKDFIK